jgi:hypothetical protein
MTTVVTTQRLRRQLAGWVTVIAVVLSALFATGTMPARAADGGWVIELCTPGGPMLVTLDGNGDPVGPAAPAPDDPDHAAMSGCVWAQAHAAMAVLPASDASVAPLASVLSGAVRASDPAALRQQVSKHTQSQAPPAPL